MICPHMRFPNVLKPTITDTNPFFDRLHFPLPFILRCQQRRYTLQQKLVKERGLNSGGGK